MGHEKHSRSTRSCAWIQGDPEVGSNFSEGSTREDERKLRGQYEEVAV